MSQPGSTTRSSIANVPRSTSPRIVSQRLRSLPERNGRMSRFSFSIFTRIASGSASSPAALALVTASVTSFFSSAMRSTLATAPMRPSTAASAIVARMAYTPCRSLARESPRRGTSTGRTRPQTRAATRVRSKRPWKNRAMPYLDVPRVRGRWCTGTSVTRKPSAAASTGMKRCMPSVISSLPITSRRNAFRPQL